MWLLLVPVRGSGEASSASLEKKLEAEVKYLYWGTSDRNRRQEVLLPPPTFQAPPNAHH